MTDLQDLDGLRGGLRRGELSSVELTEATLARAEALQGSVGAFATLAPESALASAEQADHDLRVGHDRGPWHGLPVAVKDIIDVAGVPTRNGTPRAGHHLPRTDAAVVTALRHLGAVIVGKSTTHELAFGMVTPGTRNPIDLERVVGGSSGGSAAALAAGLVVAALGTDTNGSIRCPAALCGVVGLRPTFGAVPRDGVASLAWSQDTVGPLAATVGDCAGLHAALAGERRPGDPLSGVARVATDRGAWVETSSPVVADRCQQALEELQGAGMEVIDVELPALPVAGAASFVTIMAEAAAAWSAELASDPAGFGPEVRASLRAGAEVRAADYLQSRRVRVRLHAEMRALFVGRGLDAVVLPTLPVTAAVAGRPTVWIGEREVPVDAAHARFSALAAAAGLPALTVPCGVDEHGLPIGLQIIGAPHGEDALFRIGGAVEALDGSRVVRAARRRAAKELEALSR